MQLFKPTTLSAAILAASMSAAHADVNVVASIKPVHSLVAGVMQGVGTPSLIIEGAGSPHSYALKPSQARQLQNADLVFWMSHDLEAFLEKSIEGIAANATAIALADSHGIKKLTFREGGAFDAHDHGDHDDHDDHGHDDHDDHGHDDHDKHEEHGHDDHDDHGHDDHDKHEEHGHDDHDDHGHDDHDEHEEHGHDDHDEHGHDDHDKHEEHGHDDHDEHGHDDHDKHEEHGHDDHDEHGHDDHDKHEEHGHDDHDHGEFDPHVWLDPINAKAMLHEIEEALSAADPANAAAYEANAEKMMGDLDNLVAEITADLRPVKDKGFIVFHDAYQYFENRFGVSAVGSITVSPEVMPGAQRISELQEKVNSLDGTCVFSEPQFEPKLVSTVTENTNAGTGVLDPLGTSIDNGPELYFTLIRNMSYSIKDCLTD
jgi:zinc transport system substrate-binding protein